MATANDRRHTETDFGSGYSLISLRTGFRLPSTVKAKLGAEQMGIFKILCQVRRGAALELEVHPVMSVVHLEPASLPESDPSHRESPPLETIVNEAGEDVWEIEALLKKRATREEAYRVFGTLEELGRGMRPVGRRKGDCGQARIGCVRLRGRSGLLLRAIVTAMRWTPFFRCPTLVLPVLLYARLVRFVYHYYFWVGVIYLLFVT